jgi:uncharacterized membrane protein required for colicin V production
LLAALDWPVLKCRQLAGLEVSTEGVDVWPLFSCPPRLVIIGAVQAYPEVLARVGGIGTPSLLLSVLLVSIISLLVTGFLSRALMGAIAFGQLGWLNRAAGSVAGMFLGCVLAALAVKVLSEYGGPTGAELLSPSVLAPSLLQFWVVVAELAQRYWPQQHEVPFWRRWF